MQPTVRAGEGNQLQCGACQLEVDDAHRVVVMFKALDDCTVVRVVGWSYGLNVPVTRHCSLGG